LDIAEKQILVYFADDPNIQYHQRVLLQQVDGSKWLVLSPDFEIETMDLKDYSLRALPRSSAFPRDCGAIYGFDNPADMAQLAAARAEAADLAAILGDPKAEVGEVTGTDGTWRYSDTAFAKFGQEVPQKLLGEAARVLVRDSVGLLLDVQGSSGRWTAIERIDDDDLSEWYDCKRTGAGRDRRLLPTSRGSDGTRLTRLSDALPHMVREREAVPGWPLDGPVLGPEFLSGIVSTGHELLNHADFYVQSAGVAPKGGLASEYRVLMTALHFMTTFDQVNVLNLAGCEHMLRRARMLQKAAQRSSKTPDFEGLELYLSHKLDVHGGILTVAYDRHIAEEQKTMAISLKQNRLWREEREAEHKRQAVGGAGGGGGQKNKNNKGGGGGDQPPGSG
jgi:hypothetical protein